jgi:hypothetical protein
MKRTIITFGLISGVISAGMFLATVPFLDQIGFDRGYVVGYTAIVLSFMLVFFGIKSYRDNQSGGQISFGRGFAVGIGITLISSLFYVMTWQLLYFVVMPEKMHAHMNKYMAYAMEKEKASGKSDAEIEQKKAEMAKFMKQYENPVVNAAFTLLEPFPVGLVITLVSAGILRKKHGAGMVTATSGA